MEVAITHTYGPESIQKIIEEAFAQAKMAAAAHPDLLVSKPHRTSPDDVCTECQDTADFPLTPLSEIAKIWRK